MRRIANWWCHWYTCWVIDRQRVHLHCFSPVCFIFSWLLFRLFFLLFLRFLSPFQAVSRSRLLARSTVAINSIELKRAFQATLKRCMNYSVIRSEMSQFLFIRYGYLWICFCGKFNVPTDTHTSHQLHCVLEIIFSSGSKPITTTTQKPRLSLCSEDWNWKMTMCNTKEKLFT